jgi:hypothetical protein
MESTDPQGTPGDVENDDGITGSTMPTSQGEAELDDWSPVTSSQLESSVRKVAASTSRLLFLTVSLNSILENTCYFLNASEANCHV